MNKKQLKQIIKADKKLYMTNNFFHDAYIIVTQNQLGKYMKNIIYARKLQFYKSKSGIISLIKRVFCELKFNSISSKQNIYLQGKFGKNLKIFHQNVIVNQYAILGDNVTLHGNNCIGNDGKDIKNCPIIGNNVDIGYGACIIGNVKLADNIIVGANSLVNKSFEEPGVVIAGIPAKIIKKL